MLLEAMLAAAILALLVIIALPRFSRAELRAKTSKARSDLHCIAVALENYAADNGRYPMHGFQSEWDAGNFTNSRQALTSIITTPVAYLSSLDITRDVFVGNVAPTSTSPEDYWVKTHYNYACFDAPWNNENPTARTSAQRLYGMWRLAAAGPDEKYFRDGAGTFKVQSYDPTNGTISSGDIYWCERVANLIRP